MSTLWFCYAGWVDGAEPLSHPQTLTWHVGRFLRERAAERGLDFRLVQWDAPFNETIGADDVCVGHLHWNKDSFMQTAFRSACKARVCIQPYNEHHMPDDWYEKFLTADGVCFLTGEEWWNRMGVVGRAALKRKAKRLDNAINPALFPFLKETWNPPGKRGVYCSGRTNDPYKGLAHIREIARRVPGIQFFHYGLSEGGFWDGVPNVRVNGPQPMSENTARQITQTCEFFLTLGDYDANPTTILEASCWGLIPFTSERSGYGTSSGVVRVSHPEADADYDKIAETLRLWQEQPEHSLAQKAAKQRALVENKYTWDDAIGRIWKVVESCL